MDRTLYFRTYLFRVINNDINNKVFIKILNSILVGNKPNKNIYYAY